MQKDMKKKNDSLVALLGAVLCVCACLGCERGEAASSNAPAPETKAAAASAEASAPEVASRAHDSAYQAKLQEFGANHRRTQASREKIQARMAQLRARAKEALPAGATEEQVTAELENNPRKYPAWHELVAALKATDDEARQNQAAARAAVRQRILREVADGRAQGAATAEKK